MYYGGEGDRNKGFGCVYRGRQRHVSELRGSPRWRKLPGAVTFDRGEFGASTHAAVPNPC
ncbi:MAG: hypothetical protein DHS20C16_04410 [Phycisphaerae bacterium]|nr:MAG: hypothetical protein DHS20C16_04410 [Phycisphaerae bacterium]